MVIEKPDADPTRMADNARDNFAMINSMFEAEISRGRGADG